MERLRAHLHRHNRFVLALTIATFCISASLWVALYFVIWWLYLLGGTAIRPFDFHPVSGPLIRGFVATVVLFCAIAWNLRLSRLNDAVRDHKGIAENALNVLLAVPRLTLSMFGTGAAAARLDNTELSHAWQILRRMNESDTPILVSELPINIPDSEMRYKILTALQLAALIEIRASPIGAILAFRDNKARLLAQERVRLRP